MINALLLSASREGDTPYLSHALSMISEHIDEVKEILFVPYAGVSIDYDSYTKMVEEALSSLNVKVIGIHTFEDQQQAVRDAKVIAIGGGNTFHLLRELYRFNLLSDIEDSVEAGCKYIGWSAGSNVAGLTIKTTNDMPIVEPPSFESIALVPFQLNPHYTDYRAPGHNGETRQMRLEEFMAVNKTPIVGIQEGTALKREGNKLTLIGNKEGYLFQATKKEIIAPDSDLSFLL